MLTLLIAFATCMYDANDDVIIIDKTNYDTFATNKPFALVEFYAPWCGHCKAFASEYKKAATALKGIFSICAVDATANNEIASKYGVKGYPTIKMFLPDGTTKDYDGDRTANSVIETMFREAKSFAT